MGAGSQKMFCRPFGPQFGLKIRRGGPAFLYSIYSLCSKMRCGRHAVGIDYKYSSLLLSSEIAELVKYMSAVKVPTCEMTCQVVN